MDISTCFVSDRRCRCTKSTLKKLLIVVKIPGFNENSIKTGLHEDNKFIVVATEGTEHKGKFDYSIKELKRTINLPNNLETIHLQNR